MTALADAPVDRRLRPRPLPAHLGSAMLLWLSSRAGLTSLPAVSRLSSGPASPAAARLRELLPEIEKRGAEAVAAALDRQLRQRADAFLTGLEQYRKHPFRRGEPKVPVRWRAGAARLLDYSTADRGPAVLIVPSLINRYYILDLLPARSFACYLAAAGVRPLVLDWGEPGASERDLDLDGYIAGPLEAAAAAAAEIAAGPVTVCGYCMGGLLALALAARRPDLASRLMLLATPWDFHAERRVEAQLLGSLAAWLPLFAGAAGAMPVALIQGLFLALDPFLAERKFIRFAALDPASDAATAFVALEDWINDGVPLARRVALDCAGAWYRDNQPMLGGWRVAGQKVAPQALRQPALVVVPRRDRIVPPRSAEPLTALIPDADVLRPPFGHIGMMASAGAPRAVWRPIAQWLGANPQ